ncbi:conserved hypothetical protein [Acidianus hospitalis W1]|uniref:Uncharacterized protein n=1 Tax=Acidianus hospitalis (strain W1) TaxID=933801 RepID=F4B4R3_ACIHW|nr:conserved hypothetical protein [Acidianus hospitalis W1]
MLYRKFGYNVFNLGEALDVLKPFFSKKVSLSAIKYMQKIGLINKVDFLEYRLSNFDEYIYLMSIDYLKRRATLRHKIQ